jgi:hypothetical protein
MEELDGDLAMIALGISPWFPETPNLCSASFPLLSIVDTGKNHITTAYGMFSVNIFVPFTHFRHNVLYPGYVLPIFPLFFSWA